MNTPGKTMTSPSSRAVACSKPGPSSAAQPDGPVVDERTHSELLILIERYLRNSTCPAAADKLRQEIEAKRLIPNRIDYTGQTHTRRFEEYDRLFPGTGTELLDIARRLFHVQNDLVPRWNLLNAPHLRFITSKKESLLRTAETVTARPSVQAALSARPSIDMMRKMNLVDRLTVRELGGRIGSNMTLPSLTMSRLRMTQRVFGHLSPIFCVAFDRTGRYLFTGADDSLVKLWDVEKGTLRFTFRGHDKELTDISVNHENTMIATGSNDKTVRVSCLRTGKTLEVFDGHTHQVTLVKFLPYVHENDRYLMSAANDGAVNFYKWDVQSGAFTDSTHFSERDVPNQRIVSQCHSSGGSFVAFGDTCRSIRVFRITPEGVKKLVVLTTHNDRVDSMDWANHGIKFLSGSKDGVAKVWVLENGRFKSTDLIVEEPSNVPKKNAYGLITLCWAKDDSSVITAGSDHLIRVWNWRTAQMIHVLKGHNADTYVLCPHPIHHHFLLSAGYDGLVMVWDIVKGKVVTTVKDSDDSQHRSALFDMNVSHDGTRVAAVDCHGYLIILGINEYRATESAPSEQFFDTDYRELHYDANGFVLDAGSGLAPHLMPPPVLINGQGFPYEDRYQKLVPGRDIDGREMDTDLPCPWLSRSLIHPIPSPVQRDNAERRLALRMEEDKAEYDLSGPLHVVCDVPSAPATARRPRQRANVPSAPVALVSPAAPDLSSSSNDTSYSESRENSYRSAMESGSEAAEQLQLLDDEDEDRSSDSDFSVGESRQRPATSRQNNESQRTRRRRELGQRRRGRRNGSPEVDDRSSTSRASSSRASGTTRRQRNERRNSLQHTDEEDQVRDSDFNQHARPVRRRQQRNAGGEGAVTRAPYPEFSSWMTQTVQRRFPYIPQIGDEVVYFREGHEAYLKAVRERDLFFVENKMKPRPSLNCEEFCIVLKIAYMTQEPTNCRVLRVNLGVLDSKRRISPAKSFAVWLHDVDGVADFLILRQLYDRCVSEEHQNVANGNKIQTIIANQRYTGVILSRAQNVENPSSNWFSIQVRWDNGDDELISPWDYELCPSGNRRAESNVTPEDLAAYAEVKPLRGDWTDSTSGEVLESEIEARTRLTNFLRTSIESLSRIREVKPFTEAVDVAQYPTYTDFVKYPIDLGTIAERLRNKFYRNKSAILHDVWYISENAKQFNDKDSGIVLQAKVLTEVISRLINDSTCSSDAQQLYDEISGYDKAELTFWKHMPQVSQARINLQTSPDDGQLMEWITDADAILNELIVKYHCLDNSDGTTQEISQVYERIPSLREIQTNLKNSVYANPDVLSSKVNELLNELRRALDDDKRSQSYIQCLSFQNDFSQRMLSISSSFTRQQVQEQEPDSSHEQDEYDVGGHSLRARQQRRPRQSFRYNTRLNSEQDDAPSSSRSVRSSGRPARAAAFRYNYNDILNGSDFNDVPSTSSSTPAAPPRRSRRQEPEPEQQEEEIDHSEVPTTSQSSTRRRGGRLTQNGGIPIMAESDSATSNRSGDKSSSYSEEDEEEVDDEMEEAEVEESASSSRSSHSSVRAKRKRKAPRRTVNESSEGYTSSRNSSRERAPTRKKKRRVEERPQVRQQQRQRPRRNVAKPYRYRESDSE